MDVSTNISLENISLFDFGKSLIANLKLNRSSVPNENSSWHRLFYDLGDEEKGGKPRFLDNIWFNWDGSYPKSPELSEFFQALNVVHLARSRDGKKIILDKNTIVSWLNRFDSYSPELREYLDYFTKEAKTYLND